MPVAGRGARASRSSPVNREPSCLPLVLEKLSSTGRENVAREPRRTKSTTAGAKRTGTLKRDGTLNAIVRKTGELLDEPAAREAISAAIVTAVATALAKRGARKAAREEVQELNAAQGEAAQSPGTMLGSAVATAAGEAVRRLLSKGRKNPSARTSRTKRSTGAKARSAGGPKQKTEAKSSGRASPSNSTTPTAKRSATKGAGAGRTSTTTAKASRSGKPTKKTSARKATD